MKFDLGCFTAIADDFLRGEPIRRLMFCYRTIGCAHFRSEAGGCTMCAFPRVSTNGVPVPSASLKRQFDTCVESIDWPASRIAEIDLFCAGSFFNDEEIPPDVRRHAYDRVRSLPVVKRLLVETRPEYVTFDALQVARDYLGSDVELEVAIGLESADRQIREVVINKGFGLEDFEAALSTLARARVALLVYILLKPPGLSEAQALDDAVATVRYVFSAGKRLGLANVTAAIEPVFVQEEGALFDLYRRKEFRPPWLWTVVELIRRVHGLGEIQVGTSDDSPPPCAARANCGGCDATVEAAIACYNQTQDIRVVETLDCNCRTAWLEETGIVPV